MSTETRPIAKCKKCTIAYGAYKTACMMCKRDYAIDRKLRSAMRRVARIKVYEPVKNATVKIADVFPNMRPRKDAESLDYMEIGHMAYMFKYHWDRAKKKRITVEDSLCCH